MPNHLRSLIFAFLLAPVSLLQLNAQQAASITVYPSKVLGSVNRLVFGQNISAADNAYIFSSNTTDMNLIQRGGGVWDPDGKAPVIEFTNESKAVDTTVLRYPGGCYAHNFDWRKSVGPDAKKAGWLFGLDEYMTVCQSIGAIPLITVSDYALPVDQMPANAAELVEYLNSPADPQHPWAMKRKEWGHPAPYNVTWFELGNESMHGNHRVLPYRHYSAEQYAAYANATAAAMRKVDPRIKLGIVMSPGPGTDVDCDWNHTVAHLAGASADFAIIHMYAPKGPMSGLSEDVRMQAMVVAPQHIEERLRDYHRMIRQQLGHDLPLAVTEFNGAIDQDAARFSFADALECADLLRVFLKPESNVVMASYWDFLNGPFGMLRTTVRSPDGQPASEEPALLLYKLWAQHFGSKLVNVQVNAPESDFPGAGSEQPSTGKVPEPRREIQGVDLDAYASLMGTLWPKILNVQIQMKKSDLNIRVDGLTRSLYPVLANIPRPAAGPAEQVEFLVSFDARFTPDPGSQTSPMGIGLMDARGWSQSGHSGIGVDDITADWKHLEGTYSLSAQTQSVQLSARLMADKMKVSGDLQVHNLKVTEFISGHDSAYPLITTSASTSSDGKKLYLIVMNKSASDPIRTTVHLEDFPAAQAKYWEVDAPSLASTSGITQIQGADLPLDTASGATHNFPPHSMTAIEFSRSLAKAN